VDVVEHLRRDRLSGELDAAAFAAFTHGACEAFAVALHDATGWPLVKVTDPWNVSGTPDRWGIAVAGGGSGVHWAVRSPDGLLVDVAGAHVPAELAATFDADVDELSVDDEAEGRTPGAKLGYASRDDAVCENEAKSGEITPDDAVPYAAAVLAALDSSS
jgi:hypothetical protein